VSTFTRAERISIQREIDRLFSSRQSFIVYPLRVIYVFQKPCSGASAAILISIPKKRFKRAVKRNRGKRLIRETYRLHKTALQESLDAAGKALLIAFVYAGNDLCPFAEMEVAMKKALFRLTAMIENLAASD
jgi:ribonuclease P protein component